MLLCLGMPFSNLCLVAGFTAQKASIQSRKVSQNCSLLLQIKENDEIIQHCAELIHNTFQS